jgi:hypothetical protein
MPLVAARDANAVVLPGIAKRVHEQLSALRLRGAPLVVTPPPDSVRDIALSGTCSRCLMRWTAKRVMGVLATAS